VFWWQSVDGSRVLAYRIPYGYTSPGEALDSFVEHTLERAAPDEELMVFYGVGNHGGGPTKKNLDSIAALDAADNGLKLRLANPREYLDRVAARDDIPTYTGDLQHHAVGCYSAHSGVKRWNRRAEHLLMSAERWSTVAAQLGGPPYPSAELARAWEMVLFNQFHDTLAGTAIAPAYDDARDQYGYASTVAAAALNLAAQSVSNRIGIPAEEGSLPLVVFNPLPWPVAADVEFELEGPSLAEVAAFDEESGAAVPVQRITSLATLGGRHRRLALASDVPALGYRLYRLRPEPAGAEGKDGQDGHGHNAGSGGRSQEALETGGVAANAVRADLPSHRAAAAGAEPGQGRPVLENEYLRVELDPATGWLASLFDKERQVELARPAPGGHAVVLDDPSDTWSHDLVSYDREIGRFRCMGLAWAERGPVRQALEAESTFGPSRLVERFVLGARSRQLEVRVTLDWHEQQRALKLRFPCALEDAVATFSAPYGSLPRETTGSEEVAQAWVDVSGRLPGGGRGGWALLNDGKYAYDVKGPEIGMTAARSPVFAWHDPHKLDHEQHYQYLDQGRQEFTYVLVPHAGDLAAAQVPRRAEELNERPFALPEHFHSGSLPPARSFADDGGGSVLMSVLKRAEDGGGTIVRAYEAAGRSTSARLGLGFLGSYVSVQASFAPGEVKTFLLPDEGGDSEASASEVGLLEWGAEPPRRLR
jgi:alpha-mannosidase